MNVKILNNEKLLRKFASEWKEVYETLDYATPYQDWNWNYLYWKNFRGDKQLSVFVYSVERTADAILPMWVREQLGLFVLEPIGTRGTDYIHLLLDFDSAEEVTDKFLKWFSLSKLDILNLEDLPHTAFYISFLKKNAKKNGLSYYFNDKYCPCFEIDLSNGWRGYLEALSKRERSDLKYYRRYANRNAESVIYRKGNSSDLIEHFRLHQEARNKKGDKGTYEKESVKKLISEYVGSIEKDGLLKLVFLEIDKSCCATILGIEKDVTSFNMTIGHDPTFSKLRPGTLLYGYDIEDCVQRGVEKYDLSRGPDTYKSKMGAKLKYNTRLVIAKSEKNIERYLENQKIYWRNEDYAPTVK
ncbi:GNAT family N-acetyltransferase [Patescibacteria group bacterium]|nr:GNAT family N-acetyltransferase [Patescibacteria group bacterium]